MKETLEKLKETSIDLIKNAVNFDELEKLRVRYLGKKGELTTVLKGLGKLPKEEKPIIGKLANIVKLEITDLLDEKIQTLEKKKLEEKIMKESIDITLPGRRLDPGRIHPITKILMEIKEVFVGLGFAVVEGPDVETEYYNFEALNIPVDHPSREMWDSFYFKPGLLLRSHTSPVQVRVMEKQKPPIKIIVPGKCYRRDSVDATHHWMFHQLEGLLIDERVTFADLKGVLLEFARRIFGKERRAKFIPSYFPFTEPSAEMAIDCFACNGKGCNICKQSGWIEILGAGMVNPKVLKAVGYDPEIYNGFAFGLGPDRIAMLKYRINDIRLFYDNDLRFLEQF
ncbi:MAG: phenylalanine--tRNA ligase subunit alpha [Candidatus Eremiobacteraeota bacterium]|nr:phenylalanine--tRNA ligase subunit alpha [Candidatus Eremiobacteraeota bacterium]